MIRAFGLAARKMAFGDESPVTLQVNGQRLVDLQISALRNSGIDDIEYVTGYKGDQFGRTDTTTYRNQNWNSSSATDSLRIALEQSQADDSDLLVFYGDTIFEPEVIRDVLGSGAPITICAALDNDVNDYAAYPEWCALSSGVVTRVGEFAPGAFSVFTGIMYVRKHKVAYLKSKLRESRSYPELLNGMIADGEEIGAHVISQGWMELQTAHSLSTLLKNGSWLTKLIRIHTDWTSRSERYDELDWVSRDDLLNGIGDICRQFCPSPHTYLDLGTGTGKVMQYINGVAPDCECWGIDSNVSMLSKIEDKRKYQLLVGNVENLSMLPADYFDMATARMVFHHTQNIPRAMEELVRVLKTDGLFMVCEGNPPTIRTIDWYTEMFRYKEDRHTLTEVDLINAFVRSGAFADIQTRSVIMHDCSLNNWLDNSGIPEENIKIIKEMHYDAPDYVKEDYNMEFTDDDCLMDWKFAITSGRKRAGAVRASA